MTDIVDKKTRSWVMSRVRSSKNSSTEMKLVGLFKTFGIKGWRRGSKMAGKPDFVFPKLRIVVFTDGCFWHGHKCGNKMRVPKSNVDFWTTKIVRNKQRDHKVSKELRAKGWRVLRIWECDLKKKNISLLMRKLRSLLPLINNRIII